MCRSCKAHSGTYIVHDMSDDDQDYAHLINTVSDNAVTDDWWEELKVEGQPVYMQIDTGAACSLMPYEEFTKPKNKTAHLRVRPPVHVIHKAPN